MKEGVLKATSLWYPPMMKWGFYNITVSSILKPYILKGNFFIN